MAGDGLREAAVEVMADALADTVDMYVPWSNYAEAALTALLALLDQRGFAVVPKEPDDAMYLAALKRTRDPGYGHAADALGGACYRAMLAAAPNPLEAPDGQ